MAISLNACLFSWLRCVLNPFLIFFLKNNPEKYNDPNASFKFPHIVWLDYCLRIWSSLISIYLISIAWLVSDVLSCLAKRKLPVCLFHWRSSNCICSTGKRWICFCISSNWTWLKIKLQMKIIQIAFRATFFVIRSPYHLPFLIWYNVYNSINLTFLSFLSSVASQCR